ncbi:MAG: NAD+ synthase [Legionellales bacterium]|nr:NAD+ synthase [Legionellales bacterium]
MKTDMLTIVMAQLNLTVGDIHGNSQKIIEAAHAAKETHQADLVVYPELTICGYPPEDWVLRNDFIAENEAALENILQQLPDIGLIIGHPHKTSHSLYNALSYLNNKEKRAIYFKQELPNYGVFDEKRYFHPGNQACIIELKGHRIALTICEDLWLNKVSQQAKAAGADLLISSNASPYDGKKISTRHKTILQRSRETQLPIIYVASVGGQDDLIYDGGSFAVDALGKIQVQAPFFKETILPVHINNTHQPVAGYMAPLPRLDEAHYQALQLGLHDYVTKNGFQKVLLGLSGGIDSALVLCLAVDALSAERVHAVMLPSRYTSEISTLDAQALCENLKVSHSTISIEPLYETFIQSLSDEFRGLPVDITEENIQARCRGSLLMAIANKKRALLLSTGNKSELAVGYCTLYGDMAGAYAPIADLYKTEVYHLCAYRNRQSSVIPQRIIDRPPSAELAPDQKDQDTLPEYPILDAILKAYIERNESVEEIVCAGYDKATVMRVIGMVRRNEYKRKQAAPGAKISERAFTREWRYPCTYLGTKT